MQDGYRAIYLNDYMGFLMGGFYEVSGQANYPFVLTKTGTPSSRLWMTCKTKRCAVST